MSKSDQGQLGAPPKPGDMSTDLFRHEVARVARTIGRADKIEVSFQGSEAKTDGSKIILPALPQNRTINETQARAMRGYADHESFHVRKTDQATWTREVGNRSAKGATEPSLYQAMANAIEDARIERHGLNDYPGAQKNIAACMELQEPRMLEAFANDPTLGGDIERIGPVALTWEARRRMGTAVSECERMLAKLDPAVRAKVSEMASRALALPDGKEGTLESVQLARQWAKDPGAAADEGEAEMPEMPANSGSGAGDKGDGQGKAKGKDGEDTDKSKGAKSGGGKGAGQVSMINPEIGEIIETEASQIVYDAVNAADGLGAYLVQDPDNDCWHTRGGNEPYSQILRDEDGPRQYDKSIEGAAASMGVMRRKLERLVLAKQRRDWDIARETGALDPKRLTQAALGNRNVFRARIERDEIETAVCVLIDLSGSMSSSGKARLAQQVAIALSQCLTTINVDFAVYGFSNTFGKRGGRHSAKRRDKIKGPDGKEIQWGRTEPLDMLVFKDFGESLREAKGSLGKIMECVGGNNSDPDAILEAWGRLKMRPAKRKILITLSDGSPAWDCYMEASINPATGSREYPTYAYTKAAVQRVIAEGGECAGVGILDSSVQRFYPINAVANSLEEFATKTMDVLAKLMLGDRVRLNQAA